MVPFLLANFIDANKQYLYPRRIYIDLGIRDFESSVCFMMQRYPVKFDQIHGFEAAGDLTNVEQFRPSIDACIQNIPAMPGKKAYHTDDFIQNTTFYYNLIGLDDSASTTPHTIGLNKFLLEKVTKEDFVVVKVSYE